MDPLDGEMAKRKQIITQLTKIKGMRRGSVVEQYYEVQHQDGNLARQGPYFLYSYKEKGRTISRRLSGPEEARRYREEIEAFRVFEQLTQQLVETSQRLCDLQAQTGREAEGAGVKKKLRRRLRRR